MLDGEPDLDPDLIDTLDEALDPDATSIYDLRPSPTVASLERDLARRRLIQAKRRDVARLRDVLALGWDVGPELAFEERQLAALEAEVA